MAQNVEERIDLLLKALYNNKRKITEADEAYKKAEEELLELLDDEVKTLHTSTPDSHITATIVRGTRIVIDEDRLKKQLGAPMWKRTTTPVLDKTKLEALIALGEVDPNTVALCSDEKSNKPYFKFKEERKKVVGRRVPRKIPTRK